MYLRAPIFCLSALLLAALGGCDGDKTPEKAAPAKAEAAPEAAKPEAPPPGPEAKVEIQPAEPSEAGAAAARELAMNQHFIRAVELEQAVIDGELVEAIGLAKWILDEQPKQTLPEAWAPQLEPMYAAAKQIADSKGLAGAAAGTAALVATCGACHTALGSGPKLTMPPPVPEGESVNARMLRHSWAASRMREGMIGPSEAHWQLGAGAVSVAPPKPCPIPEAEVLDAETLALRERIYEIGAEAAVSKGAGARTAIYGEYLATCAGCHVGGC